MASNRNATLSPSTPLKENDTSSSDLRLKELEAVNAKLQDRLQKLLTFSQESRSKYEGQIQKLNQENQLLLQQQEQQQLYDQHHQQSVVTTTSISTSPLDNAHFQGNDNEPIPLNCNNTNLTSTTTSKSKKRSKNKNNKKLLNKNSNSSLPSTSDSKASLQIIMNQETSENSLSPSDNNRPSTTSLQKLPLESLPTDSATSSQFSLISDSTTYSEILLTKIEKAEQNTRDLKDAHQSVLEALQQLRKQHVESVRKVSSTLSEHILKWNHAPEKNSVMIESMDKAGDWQLKYNELKKKAEEIQIQQERKFIRAKEQWQLQNEEHLQQFEKDLKHSLALEKKKDLEKIQAESESRLQELNLLKDDYKSLRTQSRGLNRRNEEYKEKLKIYETQMRHLSQESERWKDSHDRLEQLQSSLTACQAQLQEKQAQLQSLQANYEQEREAHESAQFAHRECVKVFEVKLEDLRLQLAQAHSSIDEHQRRMTVCVEESNTSKALFVSKSAELDALHHRYSLATNQHEEALQRHKEAEEKLNLQISQLQNEHQASMQQSEKKILGLNEQLQSTYRLVQEQQTQCENLSLQLQASTTEYQELGSRFQLLQDQLTDTEASLNESQVMLGEYEQTQAHYTNLKELHERLVLDLEKMSLKEKQLQQVNRSLKEEVKKLQFRHSPHSSSAETTIFTTSMHTSTPSTTSSPDAFNVEYFKSVLFKFLMQKKQMRSQLVPVLSMLLKCNEEEMTVLQSITSSLD